MYEKDKKVLFKIVEDNSLETVLAQLGLDTGFHKLVNTMYDAIAKTSSNYEAARLFAISEGRKKNAEHMGEMVNDLNNLIAALETATDYHVATAIRPANEDEILQANIEFSLGDIFKVFCIRYGVGQTLEAFIKTVAGLEKHNREIAEVSGKSDTEFAQEVSEKHLRKSRRLANLLQAIYVGRGLYQANQGLTEPLKDDEEELCRA